MSSLTALRLYSLLPAIYRIRDEQQGRPLHALVSLIAQEFEALEENVEQLYDDQFIETCEEWVAPYIGDLIGYRPLHGVAAAIASPRAEVANTIRYRRRKGTAAMLEQLARDVTDWPARAVEFFEQLATTQYMNHARLYAPATADVRSTARMLECGGPFNRVAHTAEMRRPEAGTGRYNIPNIGLFLWRLRPFRLTDVPLTPEASDPARKFRVNPLGADQAMFRWPVTEQTISHIAEAANVPAPMRIRELALQMREAQRTTEVLLETQDYGADLSFVLRRAGAVVPINRAGPPVPPGNPPSPAVPELRIADLRDVLDGGGTVTGWAHESSVKPEEIAIDPERGRLLLGSSRASEHAADPFVASFHYGFSRPIGGGEYERSPSEVTQGVRRSASGSEPLQVHLDAIVGGGRLVIEDSLTYTLTPVFKVDGVTAPRAPGLEVVVTSRNGARALITAGGTIKLDIGARGRLVLDGLVISGGTLQMEAAADDEPRELVLRHCTLVPGLALNHDGTAVAPGAASLTIKNPFAILRLEQCILGALEVETDAEIELVNCIVDAGDPSAAAFAGSAADKPGAAMTIRDSTVVGKVHARLMTLASNTIFFSRLTETDAWKAPVWVDRKQAGCMRFSVVPQGSLVPRRFHCVPSAAHPNVLPQFTTLQYGDPGYAQLLSATDASIRRGADDDGEIGVMHPLYQPQREANLRIRLEEYLRFGLHAGIFYAT